MASLKWVSCDPRTGRVIAELPGLMLKSSLSGFIGQGDGATTTLPLLDRLPSNWRLATQPNRTVLVCHYDDPGRTILWVGIVQKRTWGSGPTVDLSLASIEDWMEAQYIEGKWVNTEQTYIARKIGLDMVAANFNGSVIEAPTGVKRQRTYKRQDDMTALRALQQLMGVINGPEWYIGWTWVNGRLSCRPWIGNRAGSAYVKGASFVVKNAEWTRLEDYSPGRGANIVTAVAVRQGDKRDLYQKIDQQLLTAGYLPVEYRWQPNTGSDKATILSAYADRRLKDMRLGNVELDVKMHVDDFVMGKDVKLGDDIVLDLDNPTFKGIRESTVRRLVGWTVEADPISGEITTFIPIMINRTEDPIVDDGGTGGYL